MSSSISFTNVAQISHVFDMFDMYYQGNGTMSFIVCQEDDHIVQLYIMTNSKIPASKEEFASPFAIVG